MRSVSCNSLLHQALLGTSCDYLKHPMVFAPTWFLSWLDLVGS